MKITIKRFAPHQNAKVFAVLTAVTSLIFLVPMAIVMSFTMPEVDQHGNPVHFQMGVSFVVAYFLFSSWLYFGIHRRCNL